MALETNLTSGDRIGNYQVIRTIHPGATSVVVEVEDASGKRYAVKELLASRAQDRDERKSFAFEARLGMKLHHPNLVRVLEFVPKAPQPYFVMEFFPSYHLKLPIARPANYPMPVAQLPRIITQAATALAYLHDQGWVHRDVKPENILVNKVGEVRVIDLALAMRPFTAFQKMFGAKAPRQGTQSYMAPEQIRQESPAPSADIYSFGITCYELACGRPPFRANSTQELLTKHLNERAAPLTMHNKAITREFNDLILKMLAKKPADRPASLHEFLKKFSGMRIYQPD